MKNNPFLDSSFLFLTENPNDLKKRTLVAADGKDGHRLKLEKVAPFLKCYNCNKSSQRASYPGRSGGEAGEKRRTYNTSLEFDIPPPIPLWPPVD